MKRLLTSSSALIGNAVESVALASSAATAVAVRHLSQVSPASSIESHRSTNWRTHWRGAGRRNAFPSLSADTPAGLPRLGRTHIEWKYYHNTGGRVGVHDDTRYIADFEYSDGTPAPVTRARYALQHFHDKQMSDMIKAASLVEQLAATNRLPRIPGVKEQRDWDPEIPLFLEDVEEHGAAPALDAASNMTPERRAKEVRAQRYINVKYESQSAQMDGKTIIKNPSQEGESLTPITMFASYSPSDMFLERGADKKGRTERMLKGSPHVSPFDRRRWNMSGNFLIHKGPRPKNTIPDGAVKSS